jgi:glyoxylase-like metal-dependent hydrolase (beta-lactamase superfamily II)
MSEVIPIISDSVDSNCYLILDETNTLVDTGGGLTDWVVKRVRDRISPDEVSLIINTHGHADHCGGNFYFKNAVVMAHSLDTGEMLEGYLYGTIGFTRGEPMRVRVDRNLAEGDLVELGDIVLKVLHTPGHTPGSICLLEEDRGILLSGDTLFSGGGFGRVDLGGNAGDMLRSLERLSQLNFNVLLPGHGGISRDGRSQASLAYRYAKEFLI